MRTYNIACLLNSLLHDRTCLTNDIWQHRQLPAYQPAVCRLRSFTATVCLQSFCCCNVSIFWRHFIHVAMTQHLLANDRLWLWSTNIAITRFMHQLLSPSLQLYKEIMSVFTHHKATMKKNNSVSSISNYHVDFKLQEFLIMSAILRNIKTGN